ncbi:hypothetical protein T484DRAFT_1754995 [Baffinella frigidus]|nr:hypothetical protein T484DRAFT_1754995 [Cryptophyta sp. CCMP2293]
MSKKAEPTEVVLIDDSDEEDTTSFVPPVVPENMGNIPKTARKKSEPDDDEPLVKRIKREFQVDTEEPDQQPMETIHLTATEQIQEFTAIMLDVVKPDPVARNPDRQEKAAQRQGRQRSYASPIEVDISSRKDKNLVLTIVDKFEETETRGDKSGGMGGVRKVRFGVTALRVIDELDITIELDAQGVDCVEPRCWKPTTSEKVLWSNIVLADKLMNDTSSRAESSSSEDSAASATEAKMKAENANCDVLEAEDMAAEAEERKTTLRAALAHEDNKEITQALQSVSAAVTKTEKTEGHAKVHAFVKSHGGVEGAYTDFQIGFKTITDKHSGNMCEGELKGFQCLGGRGDCEKYSFNVRREAVLNICSDCLLTDRVDSPSRGYFCKNHQTALSISADEVRALVFSCTQSVHEGGYGADANNPLPSTILGSLQQGVNQTLNKPVHVLRRFEDPDAYLIPVFWSAIPSGTDTKTSLFKNALVYQNYNLAVCAVAPWTRAQPAYEALIATIQGNSVMFTSFNGNEWELVNLGRDCVECAHLHASTPRQFDEVDSKRRVRTDATSSPWGEFTTGATDAMAVARELLHGKFLHQHPPPKVVRWTNVFPRMEQHRSVQRPLAKHHHSDESNQYGKWTEGAQTTHRPKPKPGKMWPTFAKQDESTQLLPCQHASGRVVPLAFSLVHEESDALSSNVSGQNSDGEDSSAADEGSEHSASEESSSSEDGDAQVEEMAQALEDALADASDDAVDDSAALVEVPEIDPDAPPILDRGDRNGLV